MKSVVVFSSSSVLRAGLEVLINETNQLTVVGEAASGEELQDILDVSTPDVVVADLTTPPDDDIQQPLQNAAAVIILADTRAGLWLSEAPGLRGWSVLDRDSPADKIAAAVLAAAHGLVVLDSDRLSELRSPLPVSQKPIETRVEPMTPRETEVLFMMAEGLGNKTIAYQLRISEHTVKFHVGSIMRKLDASSRTEAVTIGFREGFITV